MPHAPLTSSDDDHDVAHAPRLGRALLVEHARPHAARPARRFPQQQLRVQRGPAAVLAFVPKVSPFCLRNDYRCTTDANTDLQLLMITLCCCGAVYTYTMSGPVPCACGGRQARCECVPRLLSEQAPCGSSYVGSPRVLAAAHDPPPRAHQACRCRPQAPVRGIGGEAVRAARVYEWQPGDAARCGEGVA